MNEHEALIRIAALQPEHGVLSYDDVAAILAEVTREAPDAIYRRGYQDAVNEEGQQTRDALDQEGVNCLVVRGPRLQFYRLFDTGTGEAWKPEIGGEPYQWRWYPADLAGDGMHDEMSVWYRKGWEAALREPGDITYEELRQAREDDLVEHGRIMQQQRDEIRRLREQAGGVLDRDQAFRVLNEYFVAMPEQTQEILDRLAACVRPATIDRDALKREIAALWAMSDDATIGTAVDRILALVRPVAGVTIAPEDFDLVAEAALWHASTLDRMLSDEDAKRLRAIAARLTRRD